MSKSLSAIRPVPRRGLSRDESAMYIGIGTGLFDQLVSEGKMPKPIKIASRLVWDIRALDTAFDDLKDEPTGTSWDDA